MGVNRVGSRPSRKLDYLRNQASSTSALANRIHRKRSEGGTESNRYVSDRHDTDCWRAGGGHAATPLLIQHRSAARFNGCSASASCFTLPAPLS